MDVTNNPSETDKQKPHTTPPPASEQGQNRFKALLKKPKALVWVVVALVLLVGAALAAMLASGNKGAPTVNNSQQSSFSCPDEIIYRTDGPPEVIVKGKKRPVSGVEEIKFLDAHCKNNQPEEAISFFDRKGCVQRNVVFTKPILSLNDLGQITPLGRMYDSHVTPTDHQYWQSADKNAKTKYQVFAPDEGYIVELEEHKAGKAELSDLEAYATEDEYNLTIEHSCGILTLYRHLRRLPDSIKNQANFAAGEKVGERQTRAPRDIRIPIKAGDQIGMVGGETFDVQAADKSVTLKGFIKAETYKTEPWKIYTTDPLSYYAEPLKSQYYAKVSRSAAPVGGKIDHDLAGKLVGNWFKKGTNGYNNGAPGRYFDGHLAVAYDVHNPAAVIVSTGHFLDGKSNRFYVGDGAVNPATVDAGKGAVRYPLYDYNYIHNGAIWSAVTPAKNLTLRARTLRGYLLAELQSDGTLKAEFFDSSGAQKSFTSNAAMFER